MVDYAITQTPFPNHHRQELLPPIILSAALSTPSHDFIFQWKASIEINGKESCQDNEE